MDLAGRTSLGEFRGGTAGYLRSCRSNANYFVIYVATNSPENDFPCSAACGPLAALPPAVALSTCCLSRNQDDARDHPGR